MSPRKLIDPVRVKQLQIKREAKRLRDERLESLNLKGFSKKQLNELEKESDDKMLYFYRKELLEAYFSRKSSNHIPPGVRCRLRDLGLVHGNGRLTQEGLEYFKRKRWLPRKRYKSSED